MALTEAALLREVAKLQRDKTLMDVERALNAISTTESDRYSYGQKDRPAGRYKVDVLSVLTRLREEE